MDREADFDVIIIGSGPAGVSAAFPLLARGVSVLMVDAGQEASWAPPAEQFLQLRYQHDSQWRWIIGDDLHALKQSHAVSPKLRVPTHGTLFAGFKAANQIVANDFIAIGSLSPGGLSHAWGCGVACFSSQELSGFSTGASDMQNSYAAVAERIGLSGSCNDDLREFFGVDAWAQPPVAIDSIQRELLSRYTMKRASLISRGFRLGRSRVAALSEPIADRQACNQSGTCLWGCQHGALYNASMDLRRLTEHRGFHYRSGIVIKRVLSQNGLVAVEGMSNKAHVRATAKRVMLGAGTLASTRLALQAINHRQPISFQSCPTAAFLLWIPKFLGRAHQPAFGLGQLSFTAALAGNTEGFGSLFSTTGIPVTEFARHLPFGKRLGIDFLRNLLPSCIIGNMFLPGSLTAATARLDKRDQLLVDGRYMDETEVLMREARQRLAACFGRLGAVLIPGSFAVGRPGADIHYSSSLPMRVAPEQGQTDLFGELAGASGVHVIDGASLPTLPAKSHTFTIMANADRIGKHVAKILSGAIP